jgi:HEAT repeat protein
MGHTGNPEFAPPLRKALAKEDNQDNLISVISALGLLRDSAAVDRIHQYVDHPQPEVRLSAVITLGNIGQLDSIQYLQGALNDTEENVRWDAAIALAKMGDSSGQQVILRLLNREYLEKFPEVDPYEQNQIILVAIKAASCIRNSGLSEVIKKLSKNDPNMKVRNAAMEALK